MIRVLFIFMKQKLKRTNQIRSSLPDTRDRWKKDEASRLAISSRNVIESPFFKSDVYPQFVCPEACRSHVTSYAIRLSRQLFVLPLFASENYVSESSVSRMHLFTVSLLLASLNLISFTSFFTLVIHLSQGRNDAFLMSRNTDSASRNLDGSIMFVLRTKRRKEMFALYVRRMKL